MPRTRRCGEHGVDLERNPAWRGWSCPVDGRTIWPDRIEALMYPGGDDGDE